MVSDRMIGGIFVGLIILSILGSYFLSNITGKYNTPENTIKTILGSMKNILGGIDTNEFFANVLGSEGYDIDYSYRITDKRVREKSAIYTLEIEIVGTHLETQETQGLRYWIDVYLIKKNNKWLVADMKFVDIEEIGNVIFQSLIPSGHK